MQRRMLSLFLKYHENTEIHFADKFDEIIIFYVLKSDEILSGGSYLMALTPSHFADLINHRNSILTTPNFL